MRVECQQQLRIPKENRQLLRPIQSTLVITTPTTHRHGRISHDGDFLCYKTQKHDFAPSRDMVQGDTRTLHPVTVSVTISDEHYYRHRHRHRHQGRGTNWFTSRPSPPYLGRSPGPIHLFFATTLAPPIVTNSSGMSLFQFLLVFTAGGLFFSTVIAAIAACYAMGIENVRKIWELVTLVLQQVWSTFDCTVKWDSELEATVQIYTVGGLARVPVSLKNMKFEGTMRVILTPLLPLHRGTALFWFP